MSKEKFLEIQGKLWDQSPSYPDELSKEVWLKICEDFYDKNKDLFN